MVGIKTLVQLVKEKGMFLGDKRKMINTKTKGELGRRIEYDVEHDLFHPQNIYSDEYITPTFVEYVQKLEKENAELKDQLTKAKDLLLRFIELKNKPCASGHSINMLLYENICAETEQFLNGEGCPDCFCEDCSKDCDIDNLLKGL